MVHRDSAINVMTRLIANLAATKPTAIPTWKRGFPVPEPRVAVNGNQFLTIPLTCEKAARLNCIELPKSQGRLSVPCILIVPHEPILLLPGSLPLWYRQCG